MQKTFGYARVSSKEQNLDRQLEEFSKLGIEERNIFIDKASGKDLNRDNYKTLKAVLREGDTLIIKSLDRLSRNYYDLANEWKFLTNTLKVNIRVIDMPILDTNNDNELINKVITDIVFNLLSYVSETERKTIKERQRAGIDIAKKKNKHLGRPCMQYPKTWNAYYTKWKAKEISTKDCILALGLKRSTFYKLVKSHEMKICLLQK